jgi:3'-phosphoadenosine 5'-phosphosulfate sulfotransferase (PAPS reductase)/FAD synthetase
VPKKQKNNEINKMNYQSTPNSYRDLQKNPAKNTDAVIENALQRNGKKSRAQKSNFRTCKKEYELEQMGEKNQKKLNQIEEIDNHQVCCLVSVLCITD